MRHRWDVYRGRRAGNGSLPSILLTLSMLLVIAFVAVFFTLPSYLVYTKDSVSLEIPGYTVADEESGEEAVIEDPAATPEPDYSGVTAEIVVRPPDYSSLSLAKGENLDIIQSVYVPYEQVNNDGLTAAIAKCRELEIKAITMELRDETGMLIWNSSTDMAVNYLLNGSLDLPGTVEELKSQGYYLTAQISACVDATLAARNGPIALKAAGGFPYSEGIFEDANKFICLGSYTGLYPDAFDALRAWVKFEFCCEDEALYEAVRDTEVGLRRDLDGPRTGYTEEYRNVIRDTSRIEFVHDTLGAYEQTLPAQIVKSRNFRLFRLRSIIDYEMMHNDFRPCSSPRCLEAMLEVDAISHVEDRTIWAVRSPAVDTGTR